MPRELCVGNGNLLVNFDNDMNIRDMYFPLVGMENHINGYFCRFGCMHATFVLTVIERLNKLNEIRVCETCGLPMLRKTHAKLW